MKKDDVAAGVGAVAGTAAAAPVAGATASYVAASTIGTYGTGGALIMTGGLAPLVILGAGAYFGAKGLRWLFSD